MATSKLGPVVSKVMTPSLISGSAEINTGSSVSSGVSITIVPVSSSSSNLIEHSLKPLYTCFQFISFNGPNNLDIGLVLLSLREGVGKLDGFDMQFL